MRKPIDVNKIELVDFHELFDKIWTEDITDEDEMMFFKFYKAGVNIHKEYYRKLESYCEQQAEEIESVICEIEFYRNNAKQYDDFEELRAFDKGLEILKRIKNEE